MQYAPAVPQSKPSGMSSGMKMAGAAAVGVAGGLAIGSIMHHEEEQSDRIERLEQEQRQLEQRKCDSLQSGLIMC